MLVISQEFESHIIRFKYDASYIISTGSQRLQQQPMEKQNYIENQKLVEILFTEKLRIQFTINYKGMQVCYF